MATAKSGGCLICGAPLEYRTAATLHKCALCGRPVVSSIICEHGHYVCDKCHADGAIAPAKLLCLNSQSCAPWEIALEIMRLEGVNMHGPEHHVIVGFALAAAYCNASGRRAQLPKMLNTIEKRAEKIPGGTCGYWGACGAGLGAGVFLSAALGATPLGGGKLCNQLTARCLAAIAAVSDVRCCKRNVGISLREAVAFLRENSIAELGEPEILCEFSGRNAECIGDECPWRGGA
ncbi:MAG: DUF5714 domain-containing protein [Oscillospiraceae bacterium]|jgi:predicted RNA-binding Zn-ribbon protein involved in translation (DUF1610 family)|nr:DUF5714 domain-containing protein [Oscillospiraceae bacterium]